MTEDWRRRGHTFNRRCVWWRIIPSQLIAPRPFFPPPGLVKLYITTASLHAPCMSTALGRVGRSSEGDRCQCVSDELRTKKLQTPLPAPSLPYPARHDRFSPQGPPWRRQSPTKTSGLGGGDKPLPPRLVANNGPVFPLLAIL